MNEKIEDESTSCYTYEVTMVIQIFGKNKEEADNKLEKEGGYVSSRTVVFKDVVPLYSRPDQIELEKE